MGKRQQRTIGALLKIPLGDGTHIYAQTLSEADFAFFDSRTPVDMSPEEIVRKPVLFRIAVHKYAWSQGRWEKIGKAPIPDSLKDPAPSFIQDSIKPDRFEIYLGGDIRKATKEECMGLECCAVWDAEHVEDRIRDHYTGVPNKWFESMQIR